jgi:hypothetical protein
LRNCSIVFPEPTLARNSNGLNESLADFATAASLPPPSSGEDDATIACF